MVGVSPCLVQPMMSRLQAMCETATMPGRSAVPSLDASNVRSRDHQVVCCLAVPATGHQHHASSLWLARAAAAGPTQEQTSGALPLA